MISRLERQIGSKRKKIEMSEKSGEILGKKIHGTQFQNYPTPLRSEVFFLYSLIRSRKFGFVFSKIDCEVEILSDLN